MSTTFLEGQMEKNMRVISVREASRFAGVEIDTVYRWIRIGLLSAFKVPTGRLRIREIDLEEFLTPVKPKKKKGK